MIITKLEEIADISEMFDSRSRLGKDCFKGRICFVKEQLLKKEQKKQFINCFKIFGQMLNSNDELDIELTMLFRKSDNKKQIYHNVGVTNKENLGEGIYMVLDTIQGKLTSVIVDLYRNDNEGKRNLSESILILAI